MHSLPLSPSLPPFLPPSQSPRRLSQYRSILTLPESPTPPVPPSHSTVHIGYYDCLSTCTSMSLCKNVCIYWSIFLLVFFYSISLVLLDACIDTSCDLGTSTLETYYSNFIAISSYIRKNAWVKEESILASWTSACSSSRSSLFVHSYVGLFLGIWNWGYRQMVFFWKGGEDLNLRKDQIYI